MLSDGNPDHTFTAGGSNSTSLDATSWDVSTLTITPPPEFVGQFTITITATRTGCAGQSQRVHDHNRDNNGPRTGRPANLSAPNALTVNEGGGVLLNISASAAEANQNAPSITISGLGNASLTNSNNDTLTITGGSITLTAAQLNGLTLHAGDETSGPYHLTVTATDTETGVSNTASTTPQPITVTVADAALTGSSAASVSGTEGASATLTGATFTDGNPGNNSADFTAIINWGDNTPTSTGTVSYDSGTGKYTVAGSHTYAEEGSDPITVTVTDDGGKTTTITGTATVADAALTGSSAASVSGTEGASATLTGATFTDANPGNNSADFTAIINWGDSTPTSTRDRQL